MQQRLSDFSRGIIESFIYIGKSIIKGAENPYLCLHYGPDNIEVAKKYYQTISNLKRRKYLRSVKNKKGYYYLTKKGKLEAYKIMIKQKMEKKKWDKKWRILIFDIPENRKQFRNKIRRNLMGIGFYQLQKSVWVFPYDIHEYLYAIIPGFREGDWFEYIEAIKISSESEEELKNHFMLD